MRRTSCIVGSAAILCLTANAHASISGFGNFSNFTVNQSDALSAPTVSAGAIQLTGLVAGIEDRSIFYDVPQSISDFSASFIYQAQDAGDTYGDTNGAAFVLQDGPLGAGEVGSGVVGSTGISKSVAITLELEPSKSGLYTNGANPGGSTSTSPLNLTSGDPISVTLSYNGSLLQESLADTITNASYSAGYLVNLPNVLGSNSAFIGFTAANDSYASGYANAVAIQSFSNFQFGAASVPEPASLSLLGIGGAGLLLRPRKASGRVSR